MRPPPSKKTSLDNSRTAITDRMDMYVTINRIFIRPSYSVFALYLVFNRDSEGAKMKKLEKISRHSTKKRIYGIVGTIKLLLCRYLIVISKRSRVDTIGKRLHSMTDIWRIDKVNLIPLSPGKRSLTKEEKRQNDKYIFMVLSALNSGDYYYSKGYNLTSSLVKTYEGKHTDEEGFIWNSYLLEDLENIDGALQYCVKIINGYVGVQYISCQSEEVVMVLVSRRRNKRVGTRYFCRGCDPSGEVANFVETELILEWFNRKCSFIILRGTAPIQWDQWPDFSFYPRPIVLRPESQHLGFNKHFDWLKKQYGDQILIDLCQYVSYGKKIHRLCKDMAVGAGDPRLRYYDLDVKKVFKTAIPNLPGEIYEDLMDMGYTMILNDTLILQQKGTFRISAVDCSDYTNVVQAGLARAMIILLLQSTMGPDIYKSPKPTEQNALEENLNELWLKQGDTLSIHYTGSRALRSSLIKPVDYKRYKSMGSWRIRLIRWYMNNFEDGFRQDCLDLMLGQYRVDVDIPKARKPFLLTVILAYVLPSVMFFASSQLVHLLIQYYEGSSNEDHDKCLMCWSLVVMLLGMWIYNQSDNYVNQPHLVATKPYH